MKAPNGYGTVAKLKGNRRNPYVVRKTVGWNDKGHPIYKTIGYYPTREAGLIALAQYNNDPWDVDKAKITFSELFELWKEKKAVKLGESTCKTLYAAYKHCRTLHNISYKEVKAYHMQECIDSCSRGYSTQGHIKNLFYHLDRFALELDIISRHYSELITVVSAPETSKKPFTDEEVNALWELAEYPWADSVLILLYTGFRISELLDITIENVDLEQGILKGGTKTKAGKDRIVPIHRRVLYIIEKRVASGGEYLFEMDGEKLSKAKYYSFWKNIMEKLNIEHTPHECRHTFRSRLDTAGANKRCIDLIMGHKSKDVGERVYTHKTVEELKQAIELIN